MPSKKTTFKKPREIISKYEESTWLGNDKPFYEDEIVAVFNDKYPVTKGHLLFIPKKDDLKTVVKAYSLAYHCGEEWMKAGQIDGFNVGQNRGDAAGQTIMWPHVHFIPRRNGDHDPRGNNGVRLAHPNGDHKRYY